MIAKRLDTAPALVLGLSPTGLVAVRSLGRQGIPVYGAEFSRWGIAGYSKYCSYRHDISQVSKQRDGPGLTDALIDFARSIRERPILYLTNDEYIELLAPHYAELREYYLFSTDLTDLGAQMLNKKSFYGLCEQYGVELPATFFPKTRLEVEEISTRIQFPAIIKPVYIHHFYKELKGKKVVHVANAGELQSAFSRLARIENELIVQEVIPGPDELIYVAACYLDSASEARAVFVGRKLRQYPPRFGSASLAESVWQPEVAQRSIDFLKAIGFKGIGGTEFKKDPRDGRLKMMEVNPRLTLWMGLTRATGVDIAHVAYQDVTGGEINELDQREGVKWAYSLRDIRSALYYLKEGELTLGGWWSSVRGCEEEAILAKDDLRMSLYIPAYAAARILRRVK